MTISEAQKRWPFIRMVAREWFRNAERAGLVSVLEQSGRGRAAVVDGLAAILSSFVVLSHDLGGAGDAQERLLTDIEGALSRMEERQKAREKELARLAKERRALLVEIRAAREEAR